VKIYVDDPILNKSDAFQETITKIAENGVTMSNNGITMSQNIRDGFHAIGVGLLTSLVWKAIDEWQYYRSESNIQNNKK
jgi:hypothetical protein